MDINSIKNGDVIKYFRNNKFTNLKVYEIGSSYGNDKIFYNKNGGFCMGKEVVEVNPHIFFRLNACIYCGTKTNSPYWCDECGDLR